MKKYLLIPLFPFTIATVHAAENCTSEQRRVNTDNTSLITKKIIAGPVKSVSVKSTLPVGTSHNNTTDFELSSCGKLTRYEQKIDTVYMPGVTTTIRAAIDPSTPDLMTNSYETDKHGQKTNMFSERVFTKNKQNQIISFRTTDRDADGTITDETYITRKDGRITTLATRVSGNNIVYQYHYNDLGQLIQITDDQNLSTTDYRYNDKGQRESETVIQQRPDGSLKTFTRLCEERDTHGNCLTEKNKTVNSNDGDEKTMEYATYYQYQYY